MRSTPFVLFALLAAVSSSSSLVGCGSASVGLDDGTRAKTPGADGGGDDTTGDGGAADAVADVLPDVDHGSVSTTYPAFPVDFATIQNAGGAPVLDKPVVVTVTWSDDPLVATMQDYGDKIGATDFWTATTSEYGVGAATSGATNHVNITTTPPATISTTDVENLVKANAGAGTNGWPAATKETIYAVYLSPSSKFQDNGQDNCQQFAGYHDTVYAASGSTPLIFAVIPHCTGSTEVDIEETAAHELVEAATDPIVRQSDGSGARPTWFGFDDDHVNWEVMDALQEEVADACEFFTSSNVQEAAPFPYWVQRSWSNKAAKAAHDPCAPGLTEPYYNLTLFPAEEQAITVDLTKANGLSRATKGFAAKLNQPVTFTVGYFSDADTKGAFDVTDFTQTNLDPLTDANGASFDNGTATVSIDKPSGQNGEKAYVTVTPTKKGALGFHLIVLKSLLPGAKAPHYLPVLIQDL
jgi:hypothetical protein